MADKKVERSFRERPLTPTEKMEASLSEQGRVSMAEPSHDKGKAALADRFRKREERWRREQSLRDQKTAQESAEGAQGTDGEDESAGSGEEDEGGGS
ncbi:MAG: hypothetical protein GXY46_10580 [Actinobacteria bacterium]|nr:hypothetical protein [Actinomycetota bacterium]